MPGTPDRGHGVVGEVGAEARYRGKNGVPFRDRFKEILTKIVREPHTVFLFQRSNRACA